MFMTYTFLIGGVILGLINLLHIDYTMSGIFMYKFEFPLGLFISIFLLVIRLIFISVKLIKNKLQTSNYFYELTIKNGEICEKTTAFLDTGNNVKFNSMGVNIISTNLFLKLYKDIDLYQLLLNIMNRWLQ